jgi:phosphoribosylglycinamide formyltransferase 1
MNLLIFASGRGTNFGAILNAINSKQIKAKVVGLICNKNCEAINKAKSKNIPYEIIKRKDFEKKEDYVLSLLNIVKSYKPDYLILAGYMKIIPKELIDEYPLKIINIHPSFLPNYPGVDSIKRAWDDGILYSGVSVHYVNDGVDQGKIIKQEKVKVLKNLEDFENKIHKVEHKMYSQVIKELIENPYEVLIVSSCLIKDGYRYNGKSKISNRVLKIYNEYGFKNYDFCPELKSGFKSPRNKIYLMDDKAIMEDEGDVTNKLINTIDKILEKIPSDQNTLAILKEKSPSCGVLNPTGLFTKKLKEKLKNNLTIVSEKEI